MRSRVALPVIWVCLQLTPVLQFGSDQLQSPAKPGVGFPTVHHFLLPEEGGTDGTSVGSEKVFPIAQEKNFKMDWVPALPTLISLSNLTGCCSSVLCWMPQALEMELDRVKRTEEKGRELREGWTIFLVSDGRRYYLRSCFGVGFLGGGIVKTLPYQVKPTGQNSLCRPG